MLSCIKRRQKYLQEEIEDMYCTGVHTHVSMVLQLLLHKRNGLVGGMELRPRLFYYTVPWSLSLILL